MAASVFMCVGNSGLGAFNLGRNDQCVLVEMTNSRGAVIVYFCDTLRIAAVAARGRGDLLRQSDPAAEWRS